MSDNDIRNGFSIAGLIIGSYFGYPMLGYAIGSALGSHVAGPESGPEGPRIDDLRAASADYGAPLPKVYGALRVPGHVIWAGPLVEHKDEDTVGDSWLSSGQTVTTYSYTSSFACAIHDGPIVGVRRIWANGQLVYDRRADDAYDILVFDEVIVTYEHDHLVNPSVTVRGVTHSAATIADLAAVVSAADSRIDAVAERITDLVITARIPLKTFSLQVSAASSEDGAGNSLPARSIRSPEPTEYGLLAAVQSEQFGKFFTLYLGTGNQQPDPTIEAQEGAGNVPAFRGTAYIVFNDLPLANYGNARPRIDVEVVTSGAGNGETLDVYRTRAYGSWAFLPLSAEPIGGPNTITEYNDSAQRDDPGWTTDRNEVQARIKANLGDSRLANAFVTYKFPGLGGYAAFDESFADPSVLSGHATIELRMGTYPAAPINSTDPCASGLSYSWRFMPDGHMRRRLVSQSARSFGSVLYSCGTNDWAEWRLTDAAMYVRILPVVPDKSCQPGDPCDSDERIAEMPGTDSQWCIRCDGSIERNLSWQLVSGTFRQLQVLTYGDSENFTILSRDLGPVIPFGDPRYDDADFWNAEALKANLPGEYGVDWPVQATEAVKATYTNTWLDALPTTLANVVADICQGSGLAPSEYDVSALIGSVEGYARTRPMSAQALLQPLASVYDFDAIERDGVLVFVPRGGSVGASIAADELGAGAPDEPAPALEIARTEDAELPRSVTVQYMDLLRDFQPQTQRASRQQAGQQDLRLSLPIAIPDARAADLAERLLWRAWAERDRVPLRLLADRARIEPTDLLSVSDGATTREVRVLRKQLAYPLLVLECVSQESAAFALSRPPGAGRGEPGGVGFAGPTSLIWLDTGLVADGDDGPGAYLVPIGTGDAWRGAAIYRSLDEGRNFSLALTLTTQGASLRCVTALPAQSGTLFYRADTLDVVIEGGSYTPVSVTEADVFNGANRALVGIDGRYELIAWQTAQQIDSVTWRLTGLLRGLRGTEAVAGDHQAGDRFYPVSRLVRLGADVSSIGAERQLRAVTFGHALAQAHTHTRTLQGESQRPLAPVHLRAHRASNGDIQIRWTRRTRIGGDWLDSADAPLGESASRWEVDIIDSTDGVRRTLSEPDMQAEPALLTYTAAEQTTDFGGAQSAVTVRIYQISDTVGRGHPAEATL